MRKVNKCCGAMQPLKRATNGRPLIVFSKVLFCLRRIRVVWALVDTG